MWISPDPVDDTLLPLKPLKLSPESFTVIEGSPAPPDRDQDLVQAAWDFAKINRLYLKVMALCRTAARWSESPAPSLAQRRQWLTHQRRAWLDAVSADPLLPEELYPEGYQGKRAYELRAAVFARVVKPSE